MKHALAGILFTMHAYCFCSELEEALMKRKDVLLKILSIARGKQPVDSHIKIYVGESLFGKTTWKFFVYDARMPQDFSEQEALSRNVIFAQLEEKALAEGRFDVYRFLICNTDNLRFSSIKNSNMDLA